MVYGICIMRHQGTTLRPTRNVTQIDNLLVFMIWYIKDIRTVRLAILKRHVKEVFIANILFANSV